jgi:hypothetical protein
MDGVTQRLADRRNAEGHERSVHFAPRHGVMPGMDRQAELTGGSESLWAKHLLGSPRVSSSTWTVQKVYHRQAGPSQVGTANMNGRQFAVELSRTMR